MSRRGRRGGGGRGEGRGGSVMRVLSMTGMYRSERSGSVYGNRKMAIVPAGGASGFRR